MHHSSAPTREDRHRQRTVRLVAAASIALAAIGVAAPRLLGEQATVKTLDGSTYQGEVKSRGDNWIITIHGIDTVVPKSSVASIERTADYETDFRARLGKLADDDVNGRIALAREAFDKHRYDLSRETLESAMAIDPNNRDAATMLDLVRGQVRMEETKGANPPPDTSGVKLEPTGQAAQQAAGATDRRLLTPADVELIREHELKPNDTDTRVRLDGDVKKKFTDSQNMPYADFNSLPAVQQALMILSKGDAEQRQRVKVLTDPQSIAIYRQRIQPLVIANCATTGCHAGPAGGSFVMFSPADNEIVAYTNFYILSAYKTVAEGPTGSPGGSVFGGKEKRMLDRGRGEESLLVNYGLPATIGRYDHPLVNNRPIAPIFRNETDERYRMVVDWLNNSLAQPDPDYGIHYSPPGTTRPAAKAPTTGNR